jgi:hypothetical protein
MLAGGWFEVQISPASVALAAGLSYAGMTVGMVAGMLFGTWLFEKAIGMILFHQSLPRWFQARVRDTAG